MHLYTNKSNGVGAGFLRTVNLPPGNMGYKKWKYWDDYNLEQIFGH